MRAPMDSHAAREMMYIRVVRTRRIRVDGDRDPCIASGGLTPESHADSHPRIVIP
jgi:hypothetical protein